MASRRAWVQIAFNRRVKRAASSAESEPSAVFFVARFRFHHRFVNSVFTRRHGPSNCDFSRDGDWRIRIGQPTVKL